MTGWPTTIKQVECQQKQQKPTFEQPVKRPQYNQNHSKAKLGNMQTLSKKEEKLIQSLKQKKFRKIEKQFVVEGEKMVKEALASSFEVSLLLLTPGMLEQWEGSLPEEDYCRVAEEATVKKLSSMSTSPGVLALVKIPESQEGNSGQISLALEHLQDPGNLGTIIRSAESLGVNEIICSNNTVDVFSPKVVQASMGSIFRVKVQYTDLKNYLEKASGQSHVYAAYLEGESLYEHSFEVPAILLMGNESKGISDALMPFVEKRISIPMEGAAESFNVAIATAIILSECRRQLLQQ
jgi:TrmH family RNA methyltransferase